MSQSRRISAASDADPSVQTDPSAMRMDLRDDFFENAKLKSLQTRALTYLASGVPVHLRGPAGTGKTALAMQIAAHLGQPVVLIVGDNWLTSSDLIGEQAGMRTRQVVDRYVHSVRRTESQSEAIWIDNALTRAIIHGHTLIYDEFTRSSAEANNPLLMALEERLLVIPGSGAEPTRYVEAHPDFKVILTSNPSDYAGVNGPQDALIDRVITLDIDHQDHETETGIVMRVTGADAHSASSIVSIVRTMRDCTACNQPPSIRAALMIAHIVSRAQLDVSPNNPGFVQLCFDVLRSKSDGTQAADNDQSAFTQALVQAINATAPARPLQPLQPLQEAC